MLVTDVVGDGPAADHLATPDRGGPDVIQAVEGRPVRSAAEVQQALAGLRRGRIVTLKVYNGRADTGRIERVRLGEATR